MAGLRQGRAEWALVGGFRRRGLAGVRQFAGGGVDEFTISAARFAGGSESAFAQRCAHLGAYVGRLARQRTLRLCRGLVVV